jgi:tripartite-type tricarboxylate transporter receptor subunit TctC
MMHRRALLNRSLLAGVLSLFCFNAFAQFTPPKYPERQARIIVPYPAGGPTDVLARVFAQKMTDAYGKAFIVENLSGASSMIGTGVVANAPADGYTLLFVTNDFAVSPATSSKVPYDRQKTFAPVSLIAESPQVIVVHPSFPAKTMQEMIALTMKEPGKHSYASMGLGYGQLTSERMFRLGLHLDVVQVPFQGSAPVITSVLGAQTPIAMIGLPPAVPSIKDGGLRALAVTGVKRSPALPDVPTMSESGVPDQESSLVIGLIAPAATPRPIIDQLQKEVARIVVLPDVKALLDTLGFTAVASTPEAFGEQIKSDYEISAKVVRDAGIKVE